MKGFSIGTVYENENVTMVQINPLPANYCSFDCVFCPLGRTTVKTDQMVHFDETTSFIEQLVHFLDMHPVDLVFINPDGEGLVNSDLAKVIAVIKAHNVQVRLLSNGYILNNPEHRETLELCDEVVGELVVTNESDFQKLLRPLPGYTLAQYVENMARFKQWFPGKFILDITIVKGYSDSNDSAELFQQMIQRIQPDEILLGTPNNDRLKGAFQVSDERLDELHSIFVKR